MGVFFQELGQLFPLIKLFIRSEQHKNGIRRRLRNIILQAPEVMLRFIFLFFSAVKKTGFSQQQDAYPHKRKSFSIFNSKVQCLFFQIKYGKVEILRLFVNNGLSDPLNRLLQKIRLFPV